MITTSSSSSEESTSLPKWRWWLSLYPRLSVRSRRGLIVACLGAAVLIQSFGVLGSPNRPQLPDRSPAGQNALYELGLSAPADPVGEQFQVNSYTTGHQSWSAVAMDNDGDFVVVWYSYGSSGGDSDGSSIQGQRYNSAGTPQGSQFQVNSYTTDSQQRAAVAIDSDGDFVVVWDSYGSSYGDSSFSSIQGQRYNSAGTAQGSQFQVNSYTSNGQNNPAVAMDSDGDFVIAWDSNGSDGNDTDSYSIQGRRYNAAGTAQGSQFQVNSYTTSYQINPDVSLDSDGDFVVVWSSYGSPGGAGSDTDNHSIQGQRYNAAGTAQGSQFQVNSYTTNLQRYPDVALDSDGDFVVVWQSYGSSGSDSSYSSILAQSYNSAGTAQGSEFEVNSYTTDRQRFPAVAGDNNGDFVVAWESYGSSGSDPNGNSIQGQRFVAEGATPTPTPTPTFTLTPTATPTASPTNTPTATATSLPAEQLIYLPAVVSDSP
jgi:hypothetical protein